MPALAEEADLTALPERGVNLPFTQADLDAGLSVGRSVTTIAGPLHVPFFALMYTSPTGLEALQQAVAASEAQDAEAFQQAAESYYAHRYTLATVLMIEEAAFTQEMAGTDEILGRNGGYVYIAWTDAPAVADAADQPLVDQARARALEILGGMTFRDIEFADDDLLVLANKFPAFTTTDLNGNAVTEEIFLGKALTVVNIWGTFCDPCVNEMPLLAAWDAQLPENVQIIGIVSDLSTPDDAVTLGNALAICQATGVEFINLVADASLAPFLSGYSYVPTTVFVDGSGCLVGEPLIGADVEGYKSFVEAYLNALE